MFKLTGKVAFITGGTKGIGKGITQILKKAGAIPIISGTNNTNGQKVAKELGVEFIPLDVSGQVECKNTIDYIVNKYGKLDILCSNAGVFPQNYIREMTVENWD